MVFSRHLPGKQHDLTLFLFFVYWPCSLTPVKVSSNSQAVVILGLWTWPFKPARNSRRFLLLLFSETVFVLFRSCRVNVLNEGAAKVPVCSPKLPFCLSWLRFNHHCFSPRCFSCNSSSQAVSLTLPMFSRQFLLFFLLMFVATELFFRSKSLKTGLYTGP